MRFRLLAGLACLLARNVGEAFDLPIGIVFAVGADDVRPLREYGAWRGVVRDAVDVGGGVVKTEGDGGGFVLAV